MTIFDECSSIEADPDSNHVQNLFCKWFGHDHMIRHATPEWKEDLYWYDGDCDRCGEKYKYRRPRYDDVPVETELPFQVISWDDNEIIIEETAKVRY